MKKSVVFLSLPLVFIGCASKKPTNIVPGLVNQPAEFCSKGEICGVGEGRNTTISFANARNEIAKQFKVNVKSDFSSKISQTNGKNDTSINDNVNEFVDEVLQGIKIKESYIDNQGKCYSFAVLDKSKIVNDLKFQIADYDTQMQINMEQKPFKFGTTKKLYNKREELNKKYLFLTGSEVLKKITLNDIIKAKDKAIVYKLEINDKSLGIERVLKQKIADNRDKVDNKLENPDRIIRGEVKLEQAYLNVSGFEKYGIAVELECIENGEVIGSLNLERYKTGRSKTQAIENAKKEMLEYIEQNVDNLLG